MEREYLLVGKDQLELLSASPSQLEQTFHEDVRGCQRVSVMATLSLDGSDNTILVSCEWFLAFLSGSFEDSSYHWPILDKELFPIIKILDTSNAD